MAMAQSPWLARKYNPVLWVGFAVLVFAVLWWLAYYGQWQGWFGLLDVKFNCLSGGTFECDSFQEFIGKSTIPVYSPMAFWAGAILSIVGLYLSRRRG
jgi:hypothetical protein